MVNLKIYTLQKAYGDIANLRGQIRHLLAYLPLPDGSAWSSSGLQAGAWNNITVDSGWTTPGGSNYASPRYRLLAANLIELSGSASAAAVNGSKTLNASNPLPTAARPQFNMDFRSSDTIGTRCYMSIQTNGVITAHFNTATGSMVAELNNILPLD